MNEAETRAELIDPALQAAGWGVVEGSKIRREFSITKGRLEGGGKRGKSLSADYVLVYKNKKLGVVEAKKRDLDVSEGVGQAKDYAGRLQVRYTYSTNGLGIYGIDMATGAEGEVDAFPTPDDLWQRTFTEDNEWRDKLADIPFEDRGGLWETRYFQDNAIEAALAAISEGEKRILLTLATGTGKTAIAFQIAWKLFHSRWNLKGDGKQRPRILFLADRNILADQAYNAFSAFPEDALVRIKPGEIRQRGRVPKNGSIFFTIFQTFMSGEHGSFYFGEYPPDFFDFIVIDECHRGGANDESSWRGILEYFEPAVQLGLTATPKRDANVDTYKYFGEPVYVYSLKEGINDGFLTPFKVKQFATTLDDYTYTSDDEIVEGELEDGKTYTETDFNRIIVIDERERYRVKTFMEQIDQNEKTLIFCATQTHAAVVRDMINQMKDSSDPNYCVRVTANDGELGEQHLRTFQDNEKTIPTILTTSRKLSTGVDARNIRNIVLMRPVKSIIEFKQIIGRGTRLFEGKDYFTVYDFVRAYEHFSDPEWDGEPEEPVPPISTGDDDNPPPPDGGDDDNGDPPRPRKIKIKLADGKERTIQHMMATTFWSPDGKPISAREFLEMLFGALPEFFRDEDELRKMWSRPDTRKTLLQQLEEKGFGGQQLDAMRKLVDAEKSDLYDVLAYVAYNLPTMTREERVAARRSDILSHYDDRQQEFLDFVLAHYVSEGVGELDQEKLPTLLELKYGGTHDATEQLGPAPTIKDVFVGFQQYLYAD